RLDAVANVAAIYPTAKIADVTEEFWDRIHSIDLRGVFFCCQEALRIMAAQGSGAIVNVASGAAFRAVEGQVAYSAAKAGPGRNEPCARLRVRPQGRTSQRRGTGAYVVGRSPCDRIQGTDRGDGSDARSRSLYDPGRASERHHLVVLGCRLRD